MSPKRLVVTMTSNWCGFKTICIAMLSMILSSVLMSGYSAAISREISRNSPPVYFRMFALWTVVTFFLPCFRAYSYANRIIRSDPARVTTPIVSAALRFGSI